MVKSGHTQHKWIMATKMLLDEIIFFCSSRGNQIYIHITTIHYEK